ncbi:hypothetical protein H0H81_001609 [Sphagnurus paluster]|uniref:Uncharacterized protein n=1 Tax=Sphagnurus paluster TaxID=117069 RepID=A0A9P7GNC9_9AGAR|nr:hypothetical protein H0H81_001609 [Sphagnurus paluster]
MATRLSHELVAKVPINFCEPPAVRDAVRTRPLIRQHDPTKRQGTYFPSKAIFNTKWNFADDNSTWEFSATVARSASTDTCSSSSSCSTPAQEIVLRYRSRMSLDGSSVESLSSGATSSGDSWETAPLHSNNGETGYHYDYAYSIYSEVGSEDQGLPAPEKDEARVTYRQSRADALLATFSEAMEAMKKDGRNEKDRLVCHRPGCRDTVRDVEALMYHLHIHNIHDE